MRHSWKKLEFFDRPCHSKYPQPWESGVVAFSSYRMGNELGSSGNGHGMKCDDGWAAESPRNSISHLILFIRHFYGYVKNSFRY